MTNAFAEIVREGPNAKEIAKRLYKRLRKSSQKAAFALDFLLMSNLDQLASPPYVKEGLCWLKEQLEKSADIG